MKNVFVVALEGVLDSTLAITLDTLRTALILQARGGRSPAIRLLTVSSRRTVTTSNRMRLTVDLLLGEVPEAAAKGDWVLVPGIGMTTETAIAERLARKDAQAAMRMLKSLPADINIGTSCSSAFLLAQAGLLAGRSVTTTWWLAQVFRSQHPGIALDETRMLVRDGRFLTAGSAFAQLDLALAVITEVFGPRIAHLCSRYLLIDERRSQARYMLHDHARYADPTVIAAERWVDQNLAQPISIGDLAAAVATSPKTLARRLQAAAGMTPLKFVQQRRLLQAAHLLETTTLSVDAVAGKVGYQDGTALRKIVKRELGLTPAGLRGRAAAPRPQPA